MCLFVGLELIKFWAHSKEYLRTAGIKGDVYWYWVWREEVVPVLPVPQFFYTTASCIELHPLGFIFGCVLIIVPKAEVLSLASLQYNGRVE